MPTPPGVPEVNGLEETKAQRGPLSEEVAHSKSPVVNAPSPSSGNQVPFPMSPSRPMALSARPRRAPVTSADLRKAKSHVKSFKYFRFPSSSAPRAPGNDFQTSTSERPFEVGMNDSTIPTPPRVPEVNDFAEIGSEEVADSKPPVVNAASPSVGKQVPFPMSPSSPMAPCARPRRAPVTSANLRKAKSHVKSFKYFRFPSSSSPRAPGNCFQTYTSGRPFEVRMNDSTIPTPPRVSEVNGFEELGSEKEADSESPVVDATSPSAGKQVPLPSSSSRPTALSHRFRRAPVTSANLRKAKSHLKSFKYFRFPSSSSPRALGNFNDPQNLSSPSLEKKNDLRGIPPSAWLRNTPEPPRSPARGITPPCPSAASFHPSDESFVCKGPTPRGSPPNSINPSDESFVCQGHSPSGSPYKEAVPIVIKHRKPPIAIAIQSPPPTSAELREFGGRSASAFPPLLVGPSFGERLRPVSQVDYQNPNLHGDNVPLTALPPVNDRNYPLASHDNQAVRCPNCETLSPQSGSEPPKGRRKVNHLDLSLDVDKLREYDYEFEEI